MSADNELCARNVACVPPYRPPSEDDGAWHLKLAVTLRIDYMTCPGTLSTTPS